MSLVKPALVLLLLTTAGIAHAKGERTAPEAKARAEAMQAVAKNTKVLGDMAGGKAAFDAAAAAAAKAELAAVAAAMPETFAAPGADDPASEAAPAIWTGWDDFLTKADALKVAAEGVDTASLEGVQAGMGAIGGTCKACHSVYRE